MMVCMVTVYCYSDENFIVLWRVRCDRLVYLRLSADHSSASMIVGVLDLLPVFVPGWRRLATYGQEGTRAVVTLVTGSEVKQAVLKDHL